MNKKQLKSGGVLDYLTDFGLYNLNEAGNMLTGGWLETMTGKTTAENLGMKFQTKEGKSINKNYFGNRAKNSDSIMSGIANIWGMGDVMNKATSAGQQSLGQNATSNEQLPPQTPEQQRFQEMANENLDPSAYTQKTDFSQNSPFGVDEMMYQEPNTTQTFAQGGLIEYANGGTHEQNPNGGIDIGANAQVEEGETAFNIDNITKYVFSDRLKEKGRTYADISKSIKNKFKGREDDSYAQRAMKKQLMELAEKQEMTKQAKVASLQSKISELQGTAPQQPSQVSQEQMPQGNPMQGQIDPNQLAAMLQGMPQTMQQAMGGKVQYAGGGYAPLIHGLTYADVPDELAGMSPYQVKELQKQWGFDPQYQTGNIGNMTLDKYKAEQKRLADEAAIQQAEEEWRRERDRQKPAPKSTARTFEEIQAENNRLIDESTRKSKAQMLTGTVGSLVPDLRAVYLGKQPIEDINLERFSPELINLQRQRNEASKQAAMARAMNRENIRNTASSSGSALANLAAGTSSINANLSSILSKSYQDELLQNNQLRNAAAMENVNLSNKEKELDLQAKAVRDAYIQEGLQGIAGKSMQGLTDTRKESAQSDYTKALLSALATSNFMYNKATGQYEYKQ